MATQAESVSSLIASMQDLISKHGLELMQRYPNDLLVHDRHYLTEMAVPGAQIAWMVGDSHTHMVALGLESETNEMVSCFSNLCKNDKFYLIKVGRDYKTTLTELARDAFAALGSTKVDYSKSGKDWANFTLNKSGKNIGYISVVSVGTYQTRVMTCHINPFEDISALDKTALQLWSDQAIIKTAGTLFVKSLKTWGESIPNKLAA